MRVDYELVYGELAPAGTRRSASSITSASSRRWRPQSRGGRRDRFVLLYAAYGRGGLERFRQPSAAAYLEPVELLRGRGIRVGLAPHSVRACPPTGSRRSADTPGERSALHVHADEQPREIEECVDEHGLRPIELLARTGCLGPRTTIVHATHADDRELDLLAEAGARICACPTTEANLGDGFCRSSASANASIGLCIGSDSNVRIDPLEELRELEGIARRRTLSRNVIPLETLSPSAPTRAPRRSGSRAGRTSRSISSTLRWPGRRGGRARRARLRLLGRRLRLARSGRRCAAARPDRQRRGRVLVITDRVDLHELEAVQHACLGDELEREVGLPVREPPGTGSPTPGANSGSTTSRSTETWTNAPPRLVRAPLDHGLHAAPSRSLTV